MKSYSFVDLLMNLRSASYVVGREPAAHTFTLQVRIQTVSEFLIFRRVADETRIEFKGLPSERIHVINEDVGNARTAQKHQRNLALRAVDGVDPDSRRTTMMYRFEAPHFAEVVVSEDCMINACPGQVRSAE